MQWPSSPHHATLHVRLDLLQAFASLIQGVQQDGPDVSQLRVDLLLHLALHATHFRLELRHLASHLVHPVRGLSMDLVEVVQQPGLVADLLIVLLGMGVQPLGQQSSG